MKIILVFALTSLAGIASCNPPKPQATAPTQVSDCNSSDCTCANGCQCSDHCPCKCK